MTDKKTIMYIAKLAKLFIDENDLENVVAEMSKFVEFANFVNKVCVNENENFVENNGFCNCCRDDKICNSYDQEEILNNVKGGKNGFFFIKNSK